MTTAVPLLTMVQADPERDMGDVTLVLNLAARWLTSKGISQWPLDFTEDGGWRLAKLRDEARRGNVFFLRWGQVPLATVTVSDWADPDFADAWPTGPRNALYVMRLAVTPAARQYSRRHGTPGLGRTLLQYAIRQVASANQRYLRLDCSRTNEKLHAYYLDFGFERVGTVEIEGRRSGALFQFDTLIH